MLADALMNPVYECEVRVLCATKRVGTIPVQGGIRAVKFSFNELYVNGHGVVNEDADVVLFRLVIPRCPRDATELLYCVWLSKLSKSM